MLEIVYCHAKCTYDCGTDEDDAKFQELMPWLSLQSEDQRFFRISKKFEVKEKPRLILMSKEGSVLEGNAEKAFY